MKKFRRVWIHFMIVLWEHILQWAEYGHTKWRIALHNADHKAFLYRDPKLLSNPITYESTLDD